jgi:hypothetical protein
MSKFTLSAPQRGTSWILGSVRLRNAGAFEKISLWAIWFSIWFSPFKVNVGLNLSFEFLVAYILFLYYFFLGRVTIWQLVGILCVTIITISDFLRTYDIRSFMFLGFLVVNVALIELARSTFFLSNRSIYLILAIPIVAIFWRFLFPESGGIDSYDQTVVGGEVTQRFNILGYESNTLSAMMGLLLAALLSGLGRFSLLPKQLYLLFCLAVIFATFSRTGIVSVGVIFVIAAYTHGNHKMILLLTIAIMGYLATQVAQVGAFSQRIIERAMALDIFSDERGSILMHRLSDLASSSQNLLFGVGFMHFGASDNSILSFLYGYGVLGSLVVMGASLVSMGALNKFRIRLTPLVLLVAAMLVPMLTGDVFGQAKTIGSFYVLVIALLSVTKNSKAQNSI